MHFLSFRLPAHGLPLLVAGVALSGLVGCSSGGAGTLGDGDGGSGTATGRDRGPSSTPSTAPTTNGPSTTPSTDAPTQCTDATVCQPNQCLCGDGTGASTGTACISGECKALDSMCDALCKSHGGTTRIRPLPSVRTSAACHAFCEKARALGCQNTKCDESFFCSYDLDECASSKEAFLQCEVDQGTWSCNASGSGWSVTANGCRAANKAGCDSRDP